MKNTYGYYIKCYLINFNLTILAQILFYVKKLTENNKRTYLLIDTYKNNVQVSTLIQLYYCYGLWINNLFKNALNISFLQ